MVKEFRSHAAGVTSVQFHPKEFLLVTGSSDRSAIVWDLERLEPLSICGPESTAVRSVQFDSEGTVLLTGAQDSLRVREITKSYVIIAKCFQLNFSEYGHLL